MTLQVTIVVGNPKPASRTRRVAEALVKKLLVPGSYELEVVDLAEHAQHLFEWPSESLTEIATRVRHSDLAIFASPTYKATYTGLLKGFLDRYPANGLSGVVAIPLHTGADLMHAMGPTFTLAPLLAELGATVPGRGFYVPLSQFDKVDAIVAEAAAEYAANFSALATVAREVQPTVREGRSEGDS